MKKEIVFLSGARTAFGAYGGALKDHTATELATIAAKGALARSGISPEDIDHVVIGNVIQTSQDAPYLARHVGLNVGVPLTAPALTVNRLCASGIQAIIEGAYQILLGESKFVLVGGTENMSNSPHAIYGARWGLRRGQASLEDTLSALLTDLRSNCSMGLTAENLAEQYGISRDETDLFAYQSQMRAKEAISAGRLAEEIVPVMIKEGIGEEGPFQVDEQLRMDTTPEALSKLKPTFKEDGVVTAGNASGINDGAAALVMAAGDAVKKKNLKPLGRLLAWGIVGVPPEIMGIGPAPASLKALERAGLSLEDMNLIEVNEVFAAQYLAVEKELGLDRELVNVNGGAVALGHPLGASGARLTLTILMELQRRAQRFGLVAASVGGGQGLALIAEAFECRNGMTRYS
jgi:acetyl-CoA C-acetyltransferase